MRTRPSSATGEFGILFRDLTSAEIQGELAVEKGANWVAFPGNLLEGGRVSNLVRAIRARGGNVLLTNVLAGGRLDGSWPEQGVLPRTGGAGPTPLRDLQEAYGPTLGLGFLTEDRRRTLPQAAIAFVVRLGAVASVPFRDANEVAALAHSEAVPPLTDAEFRRIEAYGTPRGGPGPTRDDPGRDGFPGRT